MKMMILMSNLNTEREDISDSFDTPLKNNKKATKEQFLLKITRLLSA